jgi:hypothetical protein
LAALRGDERPTDFVSPQIANTAWMTSGRFAATARNERTQKMQACDPLLVAIMDEAR